VRIQLLDLFENIDTAKLLPEREQAHEQALRKAEQAEQELLAAEQAFRQAQDAFNKQELFEIELEINQLTGELAPWRKKCKHFSLKLTSLNKRFSMLRRC